LTPELPQQRDDGAPDMFETVALSFDMDDAMANESVQYVARLSPEIGA